MSRPGRCGFSRRRVERRIRGRRNRGALAHRPGDRARGVPDRSLATPPSHGGGGRRMTEVTLGGGLDTESPCDDAADGEDALAEAGFRFLGVDVHVFSSSVRQLQYWSAVFAAFRAAPGPEAIRIRVAGPLGGPGPRPLIEANGQVREWNGSEEQIPPLAVPRSTGGSIFPAPSWAGPVTPCSYSPARGRARPPSSWPPSRAARRCSPTAWCRWTPGTWTRAGEVQWRSEPRALLGPRAARVAADIAAVVLLDASERRGDPTLTRRDPQEAFVHLVRHLHQRPEDGPAAADALVRLAGRAPAYRLHAGSSPQASASVLDRLLLA